MNNNLKDVYQYEPETLLSILKNDSKYVIITVVIRYIDKGEFTLLHFDYNMLIEWLRMDKSMIRKLTNNQGYFEVIEFYENNMYENKPKERKLTNAEIEQLYITKEIFSKFSYMMDINNKMTTH